MSETQHSAIAEQAYYLWLQDGQSHGRAETHWAAAEAMLTSRTAAPSVTRKRKPSRKATVRPAAMRTVPNALHA